VEPVAGNMGVVLPENGFLQGLRDLSDEYGAILIFDEVMTGFRVARGGAQEKYGVTADLTCLGKIIGGGLPVGAYGGKREIMEKVAPAGPVYQAGTLSGNPISMAGGIKTLKLLREPEVYEKLDYRTSYLTDELLKKAAKADIPVTINRVASMFTLYFGKGPIRNYEDAKKCDRKHFVKYFHGMLEEGIYLPPSPYEAWFLSTAHSPEDLDKTIAAHERVLRKM
jgi:glutamate-1-semialdehyde 2,1-aminomutase